ncbi:MAG: S8 family serine peptidase [Caldilineales bacterium]
MTTLFLILTLILSTLQSSLLPALQNNPYRHGQAGPQAPGQWLEQLANATGRDAADLQLADVASITLVTGEVLTRVKAVDTASGEVVGATFAGQQVVDEQAARAAADASWRGEHGALTPDLVAKLEAAGPDQTFTVSVWLKVDIEPLRKPDRNPAGAEQPGSTAATAAQPTRPVDSPLAGKRIATPLSPAELQAAGLSAAGPATGTAALAAGAGNEAPKDAETMFPARQSAMQGPAELSEAEAFSRANQATLRSQIAAVRARFLDAAAANGWQVLYASETAPIVHLAGLTRTQLLDLAGNTDIDAVYDASLPGGPVLDVARPTQNMLPVADWGGYTGDGVNVAVVEGERASDNNPYLTVVETRDTTRTRKWHPTMVSGIIASTHTTDRGLARDADMYSANGDDYTTVAALEAAMDWGSSRAVVLNNSFWAVNCGDTSTLQNIDRHMDYLVRYGYDLATVASGNFRPNGCGGTTNYVNSPSKGYNALTVGNFDDGNTVSWTGDAMNSSSQYNVDGVYKPELAASGTNITSLSEASPWTSTGSGTSFASPMVAALAADMIEADSGLSGYPEALTPLLMATSLHNIEGDARLSRADGVGAIDGAAGLVSTERDHWGSQFVDSSTAFPLDFYQYAYKGERVRYVIRWLSNPNASYTSDPLPADLDLRAYRADGTYIQGSLSSVNSFEIVDFVAPASETYRFEVSRYGSWNGSGTWLGRGWWRGVYRIAPDYGYLDSQATAMGTHLAVYPTDWSPTIYWRVMGIRSNDSDHDLFLYNKTFFDDPDGLTALESSTYISPVDYVTVDGNHWPSSMAEPYVVKHYSGTGGYSVSWSNQGVAISSNGYYGPYSATSNEVAKVFDVYMQRYQFRRVEIVPTAGNTNDLAAELFRSDGGSASSWTNRRGAGELTANASTLPGYTETFGYFHDHSSSDWLGLVVYGNLPQSASYYVRVVCTLNHDIFGDGKVDITDVQYVAGYWQAATPPSRADRDGDGDVDVIDLALVAGEWNSQC